MSTGRPNHYGHLLQVEKESFQPLTLYTSFHDLINVYSRRSGADNPRWQNFDVNRNLLSLWLFATSFKKSLWSLILYNFFHDFIHVYGLKAGADNPMGTKFLCQQEHLVTLVICCKFQKNLFEVWFYTIFFMILYMYIALGQGQTAPREQSFDVNRNVLSLHSFVASFKKMSLKSDFIQFSHDLIHVYSPGAGADSPQGTKFWCQQKGLITLPICCKFQKNLFEVWFYTIFFMI